MDLKQLQYFVVCAQTGSFSDAANVLYSTQPSVSKVVKALEDALGMQLFERLPRGIRLTPQGSQVYRYACKIVGEVTKLEAMADHGMTKWLRISANPSSWFATQFVDFYNENYDRNYHFQVYTAGVRTVMERVRDYLDDVGFVYILERQKEDFFYELSRNRMEFIPLHETEAIVYPGGKSSLYGTEKESLSYEELDGVRLVQNYQDEFFDIGASENQESFSWKGLDISVITNSDYIMEKMLDHGSLANISGDSLTPGKTPSRPGICLTNESDKIMFGYVKREKTPLSDLAMKFLDYVKQELIG